MRSFRRLPPLLRALLPVWLLATLASLGVFLWSWWLWYESGKSSPQLEVVGLALVELALACTWPVAAYNARSTPFRGPRRPAPWLESWRGQLMSVLALSALPVLAVVVALVVSPDTPVFGLAFACGLLFLLVFIAATVWALL
jgi:hypothetical protein